MNENKDVWIGVKHNIIFCDDLLVKECMDFKISENPYAKFIGMEIKNIDEINKSFGGIKIKQNNNKLLYK